MQILSILTYISKTQAFLSINPLWLLQLSHRRHPVEVICHGLLSLALFDQDGGEVTIPVQTFAELAKGGLVAEGGVVDVVDVVDVAVVVVLGEHRQVVPLRIGTNQTQIEERTNHRQMRRRWTCLLCLLPWRILLQPRSLARKHHRGGRRRKLLGKHLQQSWTFH